MRMYGPGFWGELWDDVVKPVAKGALVVASFLPPTAPIVAPVTAGVIATGFVAKGMGHISSEEGLQKFGDDLIEVAGNVVDAQKVASEAGISKKRWP